MFRVLPHQVGGGPVGARRHRRIVGGFGPALDLKGGHAGPCQLIQMLDQAKILGVEDIAVSAFLLHREIFSRSFLLHQGVLPATGLGAGPPVGVPTGQILGKQAPPGNAHAHRPVDKHLHIHFPRDAAAHPGDFLQTEFPRQHHPARPQPEQLGGGQIVGHPRLGGNVQLPLRHRAVRRHQHADIADDKGIHPGLPRFGQKAGQPLRFLIGQQGIAGQVHAPAHSMGQPYRIRQFLLRKALGIGPHLKYFSAQIDGVRPKAQRRLQPFPVPRRRQYLRFFSGHLVPPVYSFIWMERATSSAFSSPCSAASRYSAKVMALPAPLAVTILPSCCRGAAV